MLVPLRTATATAVRAVRMTVVRFSSTLGDSKISIHPGGYDVAYKYPATKFSQAHFDSDAFLAVSLSGLEALDLEASALAAPVDGPDADALPHLQAARVRQRTLFKDRFDASFYSPSSPPPPTPTVVDHLAAARVGLSARFTAKFGPRNLSAQPLVDQWQPMDHTVAARHRLRERFLCKFGPDL